MPSFLDDVRARLGVHPRQPQPNSGGYVEDAPAPTDAINMTGGPLANFKPSETPAASFLDKPRAPALKQFDQLANQRGGTGAYEAAKAAGYQDLGGGDISIPEGYTDHERYAINKGARDSMALAKPMLGRNETTGESFVMQPSRHVSRYQAGSFLDADRRNQAELDALDEKVRVADQHRNDEERAGRMSELNLMEKQHGIDVDLQSRQDQRRAQDRTERLQGGQDQVAAAQNAVALKRLQEEQSATPANAFADSFLKTADLTDPRQAAFAGKVAPYSKSLQGLPADLQSDFVSTMGPKPGQTALRSSEDAGKVLAHPLVAQPIQEVVQQLKTVGATPENGPLLQAKIQQAIQQAVKFGADPEAIKQQIHAYLRQQFPDAFTAPSGINRFLQGATWVAPVQGAAVNYFAGRGEDQRQKLASFLDAN